MKTRMSLRQRLFLAIALLVAGFGAVLGYLSIQQQSEVLERDLVNRGLQAARHLAYGSDLALLSGDGGHVAPFLKRLSGEIGVHFAAVHGLDGRPLAEAGESGFSPLRIAWQDVRGSLENYEAFCEKTAIGERNVQECWARIHGVLKRDEADLLLEEPLAGEERTLGYARVVLGREAIDEASRATILRVARTGAVALLVVLFSAWLLARRITSPLMNLRSAVRKMEGGDFDAPLQLSGDREIFRLGRAFQQMRQSLAERDRSLRVSEERLMFALDGSQMGLWDWDIETGDVYHNARWIKAMGFPPEDAHSTFACWEERLHPEDRQESVRCMAAHLEGKMDFYENEHRIRLGDGRWLWLLTRGSVVEHAPDARPLRMVGTHTDLSERKRYEEQIWHQAHYDALTGLPNRVLLHDRLRQAMSQSQRLERRVALLYLDLDGFKRINDTLGHAAGDEVIREMGSRLQGLLRESDTLARLGGDEFIALLLNVNAGHEVEPVAAKILKTLAEPYVLGDGESFRASASIGVALYPEDGADPDLLLRNADTAMYRAKAQGGNQVAFYTARMNEEVTQRLKMDNDMRRAFREGNGFSVHYQPIVDLKSGAICGAEALLRWRHPELGSIPPARFVPLAEENGLIIDLGVWVLERAVAEMNTCRASLPEGFRLYVNVSPRQFEDRQRRLFACTRELAGFREAKKFASVDLEITESLFLMDSEGLAENLEALRREDIGLAINDFGTGGSVLSYLKRFPVGTLKIGRDFIAGLFANVGDAPLVRGMIAMSHELGIRVVAEGVETAEQREFLLRHGCDFAQGFYFGAPAPIGEFIPLLASTGASLPLLVE
jgi:diguanylate cyclase (GGDEF)-like protein/PAS domain S-box-containing protein